MGKKIVLLPLDERPCNMNFPERLFSDGAINIVKPEKLGDKKIPADFDTIKDFLYRECKDADGLVISLDMLLYGGLVPSRIHKHEKEELISRTEVIRKIREINPGIMIYGFNVIMRCPNYSSDDEEPDYYLFCGKEIHDLGEAIHKSRNGIKSEISVDKAAEQVDKRILEDYINRRAINRYMNVEVLKLAKEGFIDGLVIPQDDSAAYGYAAMDQEAVREKISEYGLTDKVLIYPGADEVELTLISRMINTISDKRPKIYPSFFCEEAKKIVPLYEGVELINTVLHHITSAGCEAVSDMQKADIVLYLTAPSGQMREAVSQPADTEGYRNRDLKGLIDSINTVKDAGKIAVVADNAYANGGDLEIIELLDDKRMLLTLDGYAGWNTSANTLGTAIAESVFVYHFGKTETYESFMIERYLEDAGYCGKIRGEVTDDLPESGMTYFDVKDRDGIVSHIVSDRLRDYLHRHLHSIESNVKDIHVTMPWKRMFEIDLWVQTGRI